ncbi:MAG: hypothetical protein H0T70_03210 [Acidimicrobiia bacterium]|nr:hypothetical protein [Acidimicrobiia bacterium]
MADDAPRDEESPETLPAVPASLEPATREPDVQPLGNPAVDVTMAALKGLAGMVPFAGVAIEVAEALEARKQERRLRYVEESVKRLRGQAEDVERRLRGDSGLSELWLRGFQASGEARWSDKIHALAAVVEAAATGDRLDASSGHVMMGVIEDLEPLHVQVLLDVYAEAQREPARQEVGRPDWQGLGRKTSRSDPILTVTCSAS